MDLYEREAQLVIDYSSLTAELGVRHQPSSLPQFSLRAVYLYINDHLTTESAGRGGGGGGLLGKADRVTVLHRGSAASHHCPQPESSGEDEGGEG